MPAFRVWIGRIVSGVCFLAIARGILLWLEGLGVHTDQWVASMLNWVSGPEALAAITWTIAGIGGLAVCCFGRR